MLTLESLPLAVPFLPGMRVIYDLTRVVDFTLPVHDEVMAVYIAEQTRLLAEQAAATADPAQAAAWQAAWDANWDAGRFHLIAYLIRRVEGVDPVPVPTDPATWAPIHPALQRWLVYEALGEVRAQLTNPLPRPRPIGSSAA